MGKIEFPFCSSCNPMNVQNKTTNWKKFCSMTYHYSREKQKFILMMTTMMLMMTMTQSGVKVKRMWIWLPFAKHTVVTHRFMRFKFKHHGIRGAFFHLSHLDFYIYCFTRYIQPIISIKEIKKNVEHHNFFSCLICRYW